MSNRNILKDAKPRDPDVLTDERVRIKVASSDLTPLELMLAVVRDDKLPVAVRMQAAQQAAPYVHRKMPQEVEATNKTQVTFGENELKHLSKAELETLRGLLSKTGAEINVGTKH